MWDKGDSRDKAVLIVKKPGDHAASQKLKELGTWCGWGFAAYWGSLLGLFFSVL